MNSIVEFAREEEIQTHRDKEDLPPFRFDIDRHRNNGTKGNWIDYVFVSSRRWPFDVSATSSNEASQAAFRPKSLLKKLLLSLGTSTGMFSPLSRRAASK